MSKSVKELIYDYLKDGKEATVARKMHYFNQVRAMFNDIAKDRVVTTGVRTIGPIDWLKQKQAQLARECNPLVTLAPEPLGEGGRNARTMYLQKRHDVETPQIVLSPSAIRRRLDDEKFMAIREAIYGMLQQEVKQVLTDTGYTRAVETAKGGAGPKGLPVNIAFIRKLEVMHGIHSGRNNILANIHRDWDGDVLSESMYVNLQSKEKTMKYAIKLLTTELFHNEVILLQNLVDALDQDMCYVHFRQTTPADHFEALLRSMAELSMPTITVDDHDFINDLKSSAYFELDKIKMTVTAPTESNPNVVLTFVVAKERELVDVPAFAVEIITLGDSSEETVPNKDIRELISQYHTMLALIGAGIEYNHIPLRNSIVARFIEHRVYTPISRGHTLSRNDHTLDLPAVMLTVGKSVEKLLANNILRAEYIDRLKAAGVKFEMDPFDATARFDETGLWMIHPVILDNLEQRFTIATSEDQIIDFVLPRIYQKALGTIEREKAMRFAGEFFGTERLENNAK